MKSKNTTAESKIIFNRINDISKLTGCNTRNVQYRWNIFTEALGSLQCKPNQVLKALDFGAGSLRETYELSNARYAVDAIDTNVEQLTLSYDQYDWSRAKFKPNLKKINLTEFDSECGAYDLIIAFDVLEHLLALDYSIEQFKKILNKDGLMFISVPNRLALFERLFKMRHSQNLRKGVVDTSSIPHVNFMTP